MSNSMYFESKNDWYLVECRRIVHSNHCYFECIYSNGVFEMKCTQSLNKEIPTIIDHERMKRIIANDKTPF